MEEYPQYKDIIFELDADGIGVITLNRPEVLNAFHSNMSNEWLDVITRAKMDPDLRVLIVTGAGRGFCTGADISGKPGTRLHPYGHEDPESLQRHNLRLTVQRFPKVLSDFEKPYIAAINGPAVGGGMEMANLCDIRIASERATMGETFIRRGGVPADGGYYFLPMIIGFAKAMEWHLTGDIVSAEEAYRLGYVSKVVPHEELMPSAMELARKLAGHPQEALRLTKQLINRSRYMDMEAALEMGSLVTMQLLRNTESEAVRQVWKGRKSGVQQQSGN